MESALQNVQNAVKEKFGKDADVKHKMVNGKTQWWVRHPGKEVFAAETLADLLVGLQSIAPLSQKNGDGLLTPTQVAAMLNCSTTSLSKLSRDRGLIVAETVRGRGGLKPRYRLEDVTAWMQKNKIKRYKTPRPKHDPSSEKTRGWQQMNVSIAPVTRKRMNAFVNRFGRPPFNMTVRSLVDAAINHEIDRVEKEIQ